MKKLSILPIAIAGLGAMTMSAPAFSAIEFDQDVTPNVIYGSGNSNGEFTTDRRNGIELGLRAKIPYSGVTHSNGDGTYSYSFTEMAACNFSWHPYSCWNFDWTVNTDFDASSGLLLDALTYELGIDTDPGLGVSYFTMDPITPPAFFDHSFGDNFTANGGGEEAADPAEYLTLLTTKHVLQQSWRHQFFPVTYDPSVSGTYAVYLLAKDGDGNVVARTDIQVLIGDAPPVVQPTVDVDSYDMPNGSYGGGIAGIYADNTYDGAGNVGAACDPLTGGTGELTDGTIATAAYADPNWVGWANTTLDDGGFPGCPDPTIDFNFLSATAFEKVTIYAWDAGGFGGIVYPASISVTVGSNAPRVSPLAGDVSGVDSLELPLGGDVGDTVSVAFVHGGKWLFLTEVSFNGYVFQPVAADDTATLTEDDPATPIDVLANDDDDGGPAMSIASVDTTGTIGSVVITNDGADLTYEPAANYCNDGGPTDNFTYTLTPGGSTATVAVSVTCVNDAPVAVDNNYDGLEDTQQAGNVITNDTGEGIDFDVDDDAVSVFSNTPASNGVVQLNPDGSFTYDPNANYCGPDSFDYVLTDDASATPPSLTSNTATVSITVVCVNDAPVAVDNNYTGDEDTQQSGNVIVDATGEGVDFDVDGDGMTISSNTDVAHGTLVLNADGSFTYDPKLNYCGPDSFDYVITDDPSITPDPLTSNTATVSITVVCVNDLPTVTSVVPGAQTSDYSDNIGTVVITVNDVDDVSTTLEEDESTEPPLSAAGLVLTSTGCSVIDTESPAEDGSDCTWSYDGQVLDPGDNVYDILFTASDDDGAGSVTGTHTLTIQPEDATVQLFDDNSVSQQVDEPDGVATNVVLMFEAWETNSSGAPQLDADDYPHDGTAADGDFRLAQGYMTLNPVGPGAPLTIVCASSFDGDGYGQIGTFTCTFPEVEVNTYEVSAFVSNDSSTATYYTGLDEDAFVVYDPSLGFTTGGGWFYWPDSAIPTCLEYDSQEPFDCLRPNNVPCAGYPGDKTNFGYTMKYNRKATSIQGSALLQRHTIDEVTCFDAGSFRVKSNALYGLSMGDNGDKDNPPTMGWAAFAGKSTYRGPEGENEGNHLFFIYAEDHGEQGCDQDPSDRIWIEVWDKDDLTVMQVNGPDADVDAENIQCGNIYVPHEAGGKGGGNK